MSFATREDLKKIEQEMPWEARGLPDTMYKFLTKTKERFPDRPAISYQLLSGATDKAETLTWSELHTKTVQAANLFRDLGIGEKDTVAYVLPNCNETLITLLGG